MVKFNLDDELKYFSPFTMYMEYILLKYNKFLKNNLKDKDISTKEFLYLLNIFCRKNISQKELAELMYVSEANITKIIQKLEKKEYLYRKKDEKNKSKNIICLTKKAEETIKNLIKLTNNWELKVLKSDNIQEINELKDLLYEISENSVDIE